VTTVIARTVVRAAVPLILVTAVAALVQGHNRPGGGFIAGVLVAAALTLVYVVYGVDRLERLLDVDPATFRATFAAGLALAFGSGLVPLFLRGPTGRGAFLQQAVAFVHLPVAGEAEIASAFAFDLGVFLVVVGALLTAVARLGAE
jgi:multicomponent Na+:H+ antiporter subunit B